MTPPSEFQREGFSRLDPSFFPSCWKTETRRVAENRLDFDLDLDLDLDRLFFGGN